VKLAEVAHIVAASDAGPRGDENLSDEDLTSFSNLILLCPNCHTIVDRSPDDFPTELLVQWKRGHERRLRGMLGAQQFTTREEAHAALLRLLAQNEAVWMTYGPDSPAAAIPESADTWLRQVSEVIIPNNARISAMLEANSHLLQTSEHVEVALFDTHRRALEERHLGIDVGVTAPRFPAGLATVFDNPDS
jgi:hypothetical protein